MPTGDLSLCRVEILLDFAVAIVLDDVVHRHANVVASENSGLDLWVGSNVLRVGRVGHQSAGNGWIAGGTVCAVAEALLPSHSAIIKVLCKVAVLVYGQAHRTRRAVSNALAR